MHSKFLNFGNSRVEICFDADALSLFAMDSEKYIWIADAKLPALYPRFFEGKKYISLRAEEVYKTQATVDDIILQLLEYGADKQHQLVGIGGGIVTDITGYVAAIYKRGIDCIQVPTSVLAMVDAAVGGKNGVNVQGYKNMVGTILQPKKIIYDFQFLQTLPDAEWINGFAEIIKHACIQDEALFNRLEQGSVEYYLKHPAEMAGLIEDNVAIKSAIVLEDEKEKGDRMLLNFGHSFGHAIEHAAQLPHGSAIAIGMMMACKISEKINGFDPASTEKIKNLLLQYHLPVSLSIQKEKLWQAVLSDKKRTGVHLHFVVLNKIGEATVIPIAIPDIKIILEEIG